MTRKRIVLALCTLAFVLLFTALLFRYDAQCSTKGWCTVFNRWTGHVSLVVARP